MSYAKFGEILATEVTPILIGLFIGIKLWRNKKNGRHNQLTREVSKT